MINFIFRILRVQSYMSGRRMLLSKLGLNNHRNRTRTSYHKNVTRRKKVSNQTTPEYNPYDENLQEESVSQRDTVYKEAKQLNNATASTNQNSEREYEDNPYG
ncbi:hypothetical protein J2T56_002736 [Natronobacillus azotifigens]|uniref:Uncharacterized protein n=1 Tax=Natronobacillus azotifigens TaxID=472978 RepID=A0A9J6RCB3_9BACI|nr:hypothetical protein [Natronobacillus azotifigens]MCZ0702849.1 hypothetical protein [Natronobacillus azotifigens]